MCIVVQPRAEDLLDERLELYVFGVIRDVRFLLHDWRSSDVRNAVILLCSRVFEVDCYFSTRSAAPNGGSRLMVRMSRAVVSAAGPSDFAGEGARWSQRAVAADGHTSHSL